MLTDQQDAARRAALTEDLVAIEAYAGAGKGLRHDQLVMRHGRSPACIDSLVPGDLVIGSTGGPVAVKSVHHRGVLPLLRLTFNDGIQVVCDYDHLWVVQTKSDRDGRLTRTVEARTLGLWMERSHSGKLYLPMCAPMTGVPTSLPVDPWALGILLGDGCLSQNDGVHFCNPESGIIEGMADLADKSGLRLRSHGLNHSLSRGRGKGMAKNAPNVLLEALRDLGVMGHHSYDKYIPDSYMNASFHQRLALLQGLLDSDGSTYSHTLEYTTTSPRLAEQFSLLVQSLGGMATGVWRVTRFTDSTGGKKDGRPSCRFRIRLPFHIQPFLRSKDKLEKYRPRTKYQPLRSLLRVEEIQPGRSVCITVDSKDGLFATNGFVLTHNSTILRAVCESEPNGRILYTAYMRSVIADAHDFPRNVTAATSHGVAMRHTRHIVNGRMSAGNPPNTIEQANAMGCSWFQYTGRKGETVKVSPIGMLGWAQRTLVKWCQSARQEPTLIDAVLPPPMSAMMRSTWWEKLRPIVKKLWDEACNPEGTMRFEHGYYVKMWELSLRYPEWQQRFGMTEWPIGDWTRIVVDEQQDQNPVYLSILQAHRAAGIPLTMAGDSHQKIMSFTGAVNGMTEQWFPGLKRYTVAESHRFGPAIADVANIPLRFLDARPPIEGVAGPSIVGRIDLTTARTEQTTVIYRRNATILGDAVAYAAEGRSFAIRGGVGELLGLIEGAADMKEGKPTYHPEISWFKDWGDLEDYVANDPHGGDYEPVVDLINDLGPEKAKAVITAANLLNEDQAELLLTTAHRSKGSTFTNVRLSTDFYNPSAASTDNPLEEARIHYVACTRPTTHLDVEDVAFFQKPKTRPANFR